MTTRLLSRKNKYSTITLGFLIVLLCLYGVYRIFFSHAANPTGDVNGDGTVNGADLSILASNFNKAGSFTFAQGDINGDGAVNITDLTILAINWGAGGGTSGFVTRSGTQLMLNGQPYKFLGFDDYPANVRPANTGPAGPQGNCISGKGTPGISTDLTNIDNATGGKVKVIRAWFYQHLATNYTTKTRDWSSFDNTLSVAQAHGFKVIATLASGWGSCENDTWRDNTDVPGGDGYRDISFYQGAYKDVTKYSNYVNSRNPDSGGDGATYRDWIQEVANRYKNNTTIMMWQMINEGNGGTWAANANSNYPCPDSAAATAAILSWERDVIPLMKSIDPNHLIDVGMSNNSCGTSPGSSINGTINSAFAKINGDLIDPITNAVLPSNDVCEYHDYQAGGIPTNLTFVLPDCNLINRPVNIGEEGINRTDANRVTDYQTKFNAQFTAGVAGIEAWVWYSKTDGTSLDSNYDIRPNDTSLLQVFQTYGNGLP